MWELNVLSVVGLLGAFVSLAVALEAWRNRPSAVATSLAVFMFGVSLWAFGDAVLAGLPAEATRLFWDRLGLIGAVVAPTAFLVTSMAYAGYEDVLDRRFVALLTVEPIVTLALAFTSQSHGLFWRQVELVEVLGATILTTTVGPWYVFNVAYSYLLVLVGIGLIFQVFLRSGSVYRRQAGTLLAGATIPVFVNLLLLLTVPAELAFQLTTAAFTVTGVLFGLALFRLDLLEPAPVARDTLVDQMNDGMIAVDEERSVVDANPVARRILDGDPVGKRATEVLPAPVTSVEGTELTETVADRSRVYRIRTTAFGSRDDGPSGWLVTFDDITDVREREQRLEVLNRALRHNIRNDMSVVLGSLELLEDHTDDQADSLLDRARTNAESVVEMSEKARLLEETLGASGDQRVDVPPIVRGVVEEFREAHPAVEIGFESVEVARAWTVGERHLEAAIENLLENSIEHNDADDPQVTVRVETGDDTVRIEVADNGPGIPEMERDVLLSGQETPLEHGSGLGLWLVYWVVTAAGGSLSFAVNEPRGSVVTMELRRVGEDDRTT